MLAKSITSGVVIMANKLDESDASAAGKIPSNVLMCRQWWKVCWVYGDQEKYYRYLYGNRKKSEMGDMKIPKITTAAATSTTTTLVTLQQQNLCGQNDE